MTAHCAIAVPSADYLVEAGSRGGVVEHVEGMRGDAVQVGVIAPKQLDEERFLGLEMVVQAAGLDSGRVGDVVQRGPQARRGDQRCGGLQHLGAPGAVVAAGLRSRALSPLLTPVTIVAKLSGWPNESLVNAIRKRARCLRLGGLAAMSAYGRCVAETWALQLPTVKGVDHAGAAALKGTVVRTKY